MSGDISASSAITLRRRFDFYFGWFCIVVGTAATVSGLVDSPPSVGLDQRFQFVALAVPALWMCWLATVHPRVTAGEAGLVVVNWFWRFDIPWAAVVEIASGEHVEIRLRDGQVVRPVTGAASLASSLRHSRVQDNLAQKIEEWRSQAAGGDSVVRRRLDIHPIPFLLIAVAFVALAWLAT